ncbi:S-layer homology domain-containing protein [Heyndrickxia oleronia]|uniref:S-layer homology domain-containing protein n=1 Tax=Heyndrickxia oleronia TaxID=38875 RepID=UPI00203A4C77|nr:S-layer homology domain-containing protein [Heyndrickxia oleronia]MCM3455056.1 S-layer homology domain-containing protein [Heyndrickxia oleronia]
MAKKSRKVFATTATAALVASAVAPIASSAAGFSDVTKPEYKTAIDALAEAGILNGYENGTFKPENKVTRGEVAKVITLIRHLEEGTKTPFKDVKDGYWSTPYINSLYAAKLINGYENGTFKPEGNITRAEFAKLVVDAYGLTLTNAATPFTDVKAGNWATPYIQTAYANGLIKGVTASKFDPSAPIKRGDLAILLHRADSKFGDVIGNNFPGVELVKATNNTTVEVTFKNEVDAKDVQAAKFSIEGLTVSNAAIKQTDSKTVVLTTSAQEGGKLYTVKSGAATLGKFKGVSAVLPESVSFVNQSVQGIYGKEVTVKAEVKVKAGESKAGIPVTFNIDSNADSANGKFGKDFIAEAVTDENGVATYSYTQYNTSNSEDLVTAYATGKANVRTSAKVYWGNAERLSVKDITEGNTIANSGTKVFQVTSKENAGGYVAVTFKENVGVTPDKVTNGVYFTDANVYSVASNGALNNLGTNSIKSVPFEVTTGGHQVALVKLNSSGVGNFTLTGADATVTPVVYNITADVDKLTSTDVAYDGTDLQATASTVKFAANQTAEISIAASGEQKAAARGANGGTGQGGREYTVTLKGKDGKVPAKDTPVTIYFDAKTTGNSNSNTSTKISVSYTENNVETTKDITPGTNNSLTGTSSVTLKVDDKGQAKFVVRGDVNDYATPIAVYDNGKTANVLDSSDAQSNGEIVYFGDAQVGKSKVKLTSVKTGKEVTSVSADDTVKLEYIAVDQNGFPYYNSSTASFDSTFTFTETFANYEVTGATLVSSENNRKTYQAKAVNGVVTLLVKSNGTVGKVGFTAYTTNNVLGSQTGSIEFSLNPSDYVKGTVASIDAGNHKIQLADGTVIGLDGLTLKKYGSEQTYKVDEFLAGVLTVGEVVEYFSNSKTLVAYDTDNTGQGNIDQAADARTALNTAIAAVDTSDYVDTAAATAAVNAAKAVYDDATKSKGEYEAAKTKLASDLSKLASATTYKVEGLNITFTPAVANAGIEFDSLKAVYAQADGTEVPNGATVAETGTDTNVLKVAVDSKQTPAANDTITITGNANTVKFEVELKYNDTSKAWEVVTAP